MALFKAYDIRGVVPDELEPGLAHGIGRAIGHHLSESPIVVGRDAREHSPALAEALVRGLRDEGRDVLDIGLVSTPMLYFSVAREGAAGGVMVTASHNPAQYNGFKICSRNARPVGEASGLREIEAQVEPRRGAPVASQRGRLEHRDVRAAYADHLVASRAPGRRLKVVIDNGNGMASTGLEAALDRLDLDVDRLYFEPDGTFPNHEADPLKPANLADCCAAVRRQGADLGVAFDGDGDRAVFVDERGEIVTADLATALIARRLLLREPGAKILYDLRSSRVVAEEIERAGGVAGMCRVGHSFVKAQMREEGAVFAGELSGHLYFRFWEDFCVDDGSAALVAMLDVLRSDERPFSEQVAPLRRYAASGEINRRVSDIERVVSAIEDEHADAPEVSKLDGLLVRYPSWWFNLRPSNTEPVLRLNLEADTEDEMKQRRDALLSRIEALG